MKRVILGIIVVLSVFAIIPKGVGGKRQNSEEKRLEVDAKLHGLAGKKKASGRIACSSCSLRAFAPVPPNHAESIKDGTEYLARRCRTSSPKATLLDLDEG